ncbi:MAG: GSU2403 family nucleotidyltransferase fold protein [Propionibacteriaceae bacterium]
MSGDANWIVEAREALLDALAALDAHRASVILVGAQAIYLHTGRVTFGIAEATKDSDLVFDPRSLSPDPLLEEALSRAGFVPDPSSDQPGAWLSSRGIPVDLMVPESLAGPKGRRAAHIPPHGQRIARRTVGLEAALVDHQPRVIESLSGNGRSAVANVAGPAALLVAKLHKLGDRQNDTSRLNDKDAHDIYRLLVVTATAELAEGFRRLLADELARDTTLAAIGSLAELFASGATALGSAMAGRAEFRVGQPDVVAAAVSVLAQDLLSELAGP